MTKNQTPEFKLDTSATDTSVLRLNSKLTPKSQPASQRCQAGSSIIRCDCFVHSQPDFPNRYAPVINSNAGTPALLLPTLKVPSDTLKAAPIVRNFSEMAQLVPSDKIDDLLSKSQEQSIEGNEISHLPMAKRSDTNSIESSSDLDGSPSATSNLFMAGSLQSSGPDADNKPIIDMSVDDLNEPEMHTNNHQQLLNPMSQNSQHSRSHFNNYQLSSSGGLNQLITPSTSNHHTSALSPSSPSSSSSNYNKYHNFNLSYIQSLLAKPTSSNSLGNLLGTNSNSPPLGPSYYSLALQNGYSSSYYSAPQVSMNSIQQQGLSAQKQQHLYLNSGPNQFNQQLDQAQAQNVSSPMTINSLDLSPPFSNCGRQQVGYREPRIVGGNSTYEGEFPWAVSIQRYGNHHCGGVIVGKRWILTAAHCVRSQQVGNLVIRTGGHTLTRSINNINSHLERDYLVEQIIMHNDFSRYDNLTASQMKSSANINNADIALLRLKQDIHWNELAWPVCFPNREAGNFSGHDAVVIGWGKLNEKSEDFSNELQKVKLTIIDNKVCQNWFRLAGREMPIDERIICAGFKNGGKDACHGDSGGPLLSKIDGHYVVVGVVSTGIGCARPLLPGLYSRVSSYIGWIERYVA